MSLLGVDPDPADPKCSCHELPHELGCELVTARVAALARHLADMPADLLDNAGPCHGYGPHDDTCGCIAGRTANAMITPGRDVLYPETLEAARHYAAQHRARPLHPGPFRAMLGGDV